MSNRLNCDLFYLRDVSHPVTVAYRYNSNTGYVHFNAAYCSRHDQFSRKRGRAIAIGRLDKHPVKYRVGPGINPHDVRKHLRDLVSFDGWLSHKPGDFRHFLA